MYYLCYALMFALGGAGGWAWCRVCRWWVPIVCNWVFTRLFFKRFDETGQMNIPLVIATLFLICFPIGMIVSGAIATLGLGLTHLFQVDERSFVYGYQVGMLYMLFNGDDHTKRLWKKLKNAYAALVEKWNSRSRITLPSLVPVPV